MMRKVFAAVTYATALGAAGLLCGCPDATETPAAGAKPAAERKANGAKTLPGAAMPKEGSRYSELDNGDTLIAVHGAKLTKGDVEKEVEIRTALAKLANPRVKADRLASMARSTRARSLEQFTTRQALLAEAKKRGIALTEEMRANIRATFAGSLGARFKKKGFDAIYAALPSAFAEQLAKDLDLDAVCSATRKAIKAECAYTPTEDDVKKAKENMAKYNERAKKVEAETYALATNIWKAVAAAGNDIEAANNFDTDEHTIVDPEWGEFEMSFFDDEPELAKLLGSAKEGDLTPPVAGQNGLAIFKVEGWTTPTFTGKDTKPRIRLGRVFFELPEFYDATTDEELKKQIAEEKQEAAFDEKIKTLRTSTKAERPNGAILFR